MTTYTCCAVLCCRVARDFAAEDRVAILTWTRVHRVPPPSTTARSRFTTSPGPGTSRSAVRRPTTATAAQYRRSVIDNLDAALHRPSGFNDYSLPGRRRSAMPMDDSDGNATARRGSVFDAPHRRSVIQIGIPDPSPAGQGGGLGRRASMASVKDTGRGRRASALNASESAAPSRRSSSHDPAVGRTGSRREFTSRDSDARSTASPPSQSQPEHTHRNSVVRIQEPAATGRRRSSVTRATSADSRRGRSESVSHVGSPRIGGDGGPRRASVVRIQEPSSSPTRPNRASVVRIHEPGRVDGGDSYGTAPAMVERQHSDRDGGPPGQPPPRGPSHRSSLARGKGSDSGSPTRQTRTMPLALAADRPPSLRAAGSGRPLPRPLLARTKSGADIVNDMLDGWRSGRGCVYARTGSKRDLLAAASDSRRAGAGAAPPLKSGSSTSVTSNGHGAVVTELATGTSGRCPYQPPTGATARSVRSGLGLSTRTMAAAASIPSDQPTRPHIPRLTRTADTSDDFGDGNGGDSPVFQFAIGSTDSEVCNGGGG